MQPPLRGWGVEFGRVLGCAATGVYRTWMPNDPGSAFFSPPLAVKLSVNGTRAWASFQTPSPPSSVSSYQYRSPVPLAVPWLLPMVP